MSKDAAIVGVILMVAITVILAAVIAAFVAGLSANVQNNQSTPNNCVYEKTATITYIRTGAFDEDYIIANGQQYLIPYSKTTGVNSKLSGHNITFQYDSTNHVVTLLCDHGFAVCQPTPVCTPVPTPACGCGS